MVGLFKKFSDYTYSEIAIIVDSKDYSPLYGAIENISNYLSDCLTNKELSLRPIRYRTITDGISGKERVIGIQNPLHQICDYIAVEGLRELFDRKIGVFQCASLKGKGQIYGKKYISKWIQEKDSKVYIQCDIVKYFPSVSHDILKDKLVKNVKNDTLPWLAFYLIDMFDKGLSIGSYLSQYLANYYLSFLYNYACQELYKIRKTKRKGNVRVRLIKHMLFYMDDFILIGSSKKDVRKALNIMVEYLRDELQLEIKPWKICKVSDHEPIDMMGFVFRKGRTIIRSTIFLRARRRYLKAIRYLKQSKIIPRRLAYQCIAAYGWLINSDSYGIRKRLNIDKIHEICRRLVGYYTKIERGANIEIVA